MKTAIENNQMDSQAQGFGFEELILMLIGQDRKTQMNFRKQVLKKARSIRNGQMRAKSVSNRPNRRMQFAS